jgi:RND family efflux transporter MFP subunit
MTELKRDLDALRIERTPERSGAGRWIVWTGLLVLAIAFGVGAWQWLTRPRPVEVQVATVSERAAGTQASVLNASGYVTARRRATVSSKVTGKVVEVNVEEGMAVREGQVLARLDDSTLRAALALAEAQAEAARRGLRENEVRLDQARVTERRTGQLFKEKIVTQADVDQSKSEADAIEARIEALREQIRVAERQIDVQRTNLNDTVIRAPFSGVAISKDAQPGEMVSPVSAGGGFTRTGICTIVDMKSLEIEVDVNESYINRVKPGQAVIATLDAYQDWQIPARVITMVPTADRQKATILVRIGFVDLDPRLLPDMAIKVTFLRQPDDAASPATQPTTLVPKAAVRNTGTDNFAFVLRGETVERRAVKLGGADGDRVEVLAGLQAGDRVVMSPPPGLKEGDLVTVQ